MLLRFRVQGLEFERLEFRVPGLGLRAQGLGSGVQ